MPEQVEHSPQPAVPPPIDAPPRDPFPEIDLRQLLRMTDDTGMFQHAVYGMPDPNHGYCIDDNARALIAALLYAQLRGYDERVVPLHRYLSFLAYAFNDKTRSFRNFMSYDRRWLEEAGSQDSQGRTLWALGLTVSLAPREGVGDLARDLFHRGLPALERFEYHRSRAFGLLGLDHYLRQTPGDDHAAALRARFAQRLFEDYQAHASQDWPWWEDQVTYDNAKLSHALLVSGAAMDRADMVEAGLVSLAWLLKVQTASDAAAQRARDAADAGGAEDEEDGRRPPAPSAPPTHADQPAAHLSIIGNRGWLKRDGGRARFDQQPLEAYALVHACLTAAKLTGDPAWADHAWRCFEWFRGRNDLGLSLYDASTGGCHDGLLESGVNTNQGAESSLAYLLSVLELHRHREARTGRITVGAPRTIGYAIAGVSSFAEFCLEQYQRIEGLKPVAVWNRTTSKARRLGSEKGLAVHEDYQALLADPSVHLVHVATTPATHARFAQPALAAGKHVLCEKPLATDATDAREMIETGARRDLVLAVNFMMRYGPLTNPIQRILQSCALGAPLRGMFINRAGDEGLPPGHWFWDESAGGGIFVEHGVHFFDLARYWLGDGAVQSAQRLARPKEASTGETASHKSATNAAARHMIDQVSCDVRYAEAAGPTTVNFYHTFNQPAPMDSQDFRLIFERGQLWVRGWIPSELTLHAVVTEPELEQLKTLLPDGARVSTLQRFEGEQRKLAHRGRIDQLDREVRIQWADQRDKQTIYGQSLQALMEDALQAVHERAHRPKTSGEDGLAAVKLALEARRLAGG